MTAAAAAEPLEGQGLHTPPILLAAPSFHIARRICSLLVENPVATQIGRQLSDCTRWVAVE